MCVHCTLSGSSINSNIIYVLSNYAKPPKLNKTRVVSNSTDSNSDRWRGRQVLNPLDQHLRRRLREFSVKLFRSYTTEDKLACTYSNILEP